MPGASTSAAEASLSFASVAEGVANALASSTSPAGDATFRVWVRSLYERVRGAGDIPFAKAVVMAVIRAVPGGAAGAELPRCGPQQWVHHC